MKNTRKGFTIVELVIVIAVIAILAAVLIPTFVSLTKKANLSSDQQAVRTINTALATAEATDGKPANVDAAMAIIAAAGYDVASYKPLTKELEIYWVDTINRVVLYSVSEGKVIYPEQYVDLYNNDGSWHVFNESYKNAISVNLNTKVESSDFDANGEFTTTVAGSTATGSTMTVTYVKNADNSISAPTFTIVKPSNYDKNNADMATVYEKQAGNFLYTLAVQYNEDMISGADGKVAEEVNIVIPSDMPVNVSDYLWKPIKNFSGTIAPAGEEEATIVGLSLNKDLSYVDSVAFDGSGENASLSKYNVFGFISNITSGTVENITFKDIKVDLPGDDYISYLKNMGDTSGVSASVFGVIGGITPDYTNGNQKVDVTVKNVVIDGGTIKGIGRVGGVVGYIGGSKALKTAAGSTVTIKDCTVNGVSILSGLKSNGYGSAGAIISYICRNEGVAITIDNCTVTNNIISGLKTGALVGWYNTSDNGFGTTSITIKNCTVKDNQMLDNGLKTGEFYAGLLFGDTNQTDNLLNEKDKPEDDNVLNTAGTTEIQKSATEKITVVIDEATITNATGNTIKDRNGNVTNAK